MSQFIVPDYCMDLKVKEVAIKLLEHLILNKEIIAYSDLTKLLSFDINPRNIEGQLGNISQACLDNGLPPLSAIVVNKETLMPGDGFFKFFYPGLKGDERIVKFFALRKEIIEFEDWNDVKKAFEEV